MKQLLLLPILLLSFKNQAQECVESIIHSDDNITVRLQDGSLYTWGLNQFGQLGTGNTTPVTTPASTVLADQWETVLHARMHTIALDHDGNLWAWGNNAVGQLGDGTGAPYSYAPVNTNSGSDWATISAGNLHSVGLKSNGTLWGWGNNGAYELTGDLPNFHNVPIQISNDTDWNKVYAGFFKTYGIKNNGTLWGRGRNSYADLGTGNSVEVLVFTQIGTANNWTKISGARTYATLGLRSDNTLWAWGDNQNGRLGDGTTTNRPAPVQIPGQWKDVSMGNFHALGIKADGTLWHWGSYGWIDGVMLIPTSWVPVQVGTDNDWKSVVAGYSSSFAIKENNTLWAWGYNGGGWLGNGTTTSTVTPIQIMGCNLMSTPDADQNALVAYPNPVKDVLKWNADDTIESFQIINALGQPVKSGTANRNEIELSQLSEGLYFLLLESATGKIHKTKFIKE